MAKVLRTAAVIVGAVALVATGIGAIAGTTFGATLLGGGSWAVGASIGVAAGQIASIATYVAAGLAVGASLLAKPPPLGGNATKFKADTAAPLPYMIGRTATAGNIVYRRTHNTTGYSLPDLQTFAVILSCAGPVQSIDSFTADNVAVSFSGGSASGSYATWMFQNTQLGQSPESAALSNAGLYVSSGKSTSAAPGWGSTAKLSGFAAALWTLRYDQKGKQYANGIPKPLWVGHWVKVYDPRLDSTYPGGSGSCRALNESTYVWSENPYLHGLTWALGRWQNGKRIAGIGAPIAGIDVAAFVEGANIADANGWTIGGAVSTGDNKWAVLKTMLQAGAGEPIHVGATIGCIVSTPRTVLATVNVGDVAGEVRAAATTPRRGRINSIIPRYRSEDHDWEIVSAEPVTVAAHVTTDGGLRQRETTYSLVQGATQAAVLARYDIENAREFGPISLPLKPRWLGYKPGDCIAVTLPEVGLNAQPVVIRNRSIDPGSTICTLSAVSETGGKHAFALGQTGTPPPTPSVTAPPVAPQPGASDWTIAATNLTAGASVTPALVVTGSADGAPVDAVVFEYRLYVSGQAADVGWIVGGTDLPGALRKEITALLPGTAYEVAVSYTLRGFPGARRVLGPVTTSGVGVPWGGVGGSDRPDDSATVGDNLITNARFAVDASGWFNPGSAYVRAAAVSGGPASFAYQTTTGNGSSFYPSTYIPAFGGKKIYSGAWFYVAVATSISFGLQEYNAAGSVTNTFNESIALSVGWTRIERQYTLGSTTVKVLPLYYFGPYGGGTISQMTEPRLSYSQPGADVTSGSQVVVSVDGLQAYDASYTGVIVGSLEPTQVRVARGGASIKGLDGVRYAITTSSGLTATIDDTNGSTTKGLITPTAFSGNYATCMVTVTVDGVVQPVQTIVFQKTLALPPALGGSTAKMATDTTLTAISGTSFVAISDVMTVALGSGETLYGTAVLDYSVSGAGLQSRTVDAKWQRSPTGAGTWTDFAGAVTGSTANSGGYNGFDEYVDATLGAIDANQSSAPAAGTYDVRLVAAVSATGRTITFYGSAIIEAKV